MTFKDNYDLELLVNEAEHLVFDELEKQLESDKNDKICKCQECILDMAAFALNNVKPAYRSSFTGVIYAQRLKDGEYKKQLTLAVKKAIEKIRKNPAHEIAKAE
jgi:competence protein ComFB